MLNRLFIWTLVLISEAWLQSSFGENKRKDNVIKPPSRSFHQRKLEHSWIITSVVFSGWRLNTTCVRSNRNWKEATEAQIWKCRNPVMNHIHSTTNVGKHWHTHFEQRWCGRLSYGGTAGLLWLNTREMRALTFYMVSWSEWISCVFRTRLVVKG